MVFRCARLARETSATILYTAILFNNYSPKGQLILLNNPRDEVEGDYLTILTEPEVNNCFGIFTLSDLNRIRKETIKKGSCVNTKPLTVDVQTLDLYSIFKHDK